MLAAHSKVRNIGCGLCVWVELFYRFRLSGKGFGIDAVTHFDRGIYLVVRIRRDCGIFGCSVSTLLQIVGLRYRDLPGPSFRMLPRRRYFNARRNFQAPLAIWMVLKIALVLT